MCRRCFTFQAQQQQLTWFCVGVPPLHVRGPNRDLTRNDLTDIMSGGSSGRGRRTWTSNCDGVTHDTLVRVDDYGTGTTEYVGRYEPRSALIGLYTPAMLTRIRRCWFMLCYVSFLSLERALPYNALICVCPRVLAWLFYLSQCGAPGDGLRYGCDVSNAGVPFGSFKLPERLAISVSPPPPPTRAPRDIGLAHSCSTSQFDA